MLELQPGLTFGLKNLLVLAVSVEIDGTRDAHYRLVIIRIIP